MPAPVSPTGCFLAFRTGRRRNMANEHARRSDSREPHERTRASSFPFGRHGTLPSSPCRTTTRSAIVPGLPDRPRQRRSRAIPLAQMVRAAGMPPKFRLAYNRSDAMPSEATGGQSRTSAILLHGWAESLWGSTSLVPWFACARRDAGTTLVETKVSVDGQGASGSRSPIQPPGGAWGRCAPSGNNTFQRSPWVPP